MYFWVGVNETRTKANAVRFLAPYLSRTTHFRVVPSFHYVRHRFPGQCSEARVDYLLLISQSDDRKLLACQTPAPGGKRSV